MKTICGEVCGYCGARRDESPESSICPNTADSLHTWDSEPWKTAAICERKHLEMLRNASDYLTLKSYNGDQGGDCMNYWEWNVAMCSAIGIVKDAISAVCLSKPTCQATVVRHVEDPGYLCGKKCVEGSYLCAEHQDLEN